MPFNYLVVKPRAIFVAPLVALFVAPLVAHFAALPITSPVALTFQTKGVLI
ncbi:MAG: light-harvesting protein [Deltaproteobacteria bacterium]|nr:light-harvesting protein [Deltaproteobacteria bacterium]